MRLAHAPPRSFVPSVVWAWSNESMVRSLYGLHAASVMALATHDGRAERRRNAQGELVWWYYVVVAGTA